RLPKTRPSQTLRGVPPRPVGEQPLDALQPLLDRGKAALDRRLARTGGGEHAAGRPGLLAGSQPPQDLLAAPAEGEPETAQGPRSGALALAQQAEQDVLAADVVVAELQRLTQREFEHLLRARRERDVAGGFVLFRADRLFDPVAHGLKLGAGAGE